MTRRHPTYLLRFGAPIAPLPTRTESDIAVEPFRFSMRPDGGAKAAPTDHALGGFDVRRPKRLRPSDPQSARSIPALAEARPSAAARVTPTNPP